MESQDVQRWDQTKGLKPYRQCSQVMNLKHFQYLNQTLVKARERYIEPHRPSDSPFRATYSPSSCLLHTADSHLFPATWSGFIFFKLSGLAKRDPKETGIPACAWPNLQFPPPLSEALHMFHTEWWCERLPHPKDPMPSLKSWTLGSGESNSAIN